MVSKNIIVSHLVELCHQHGVQHIIISPGSRNAPFTISFNEDDRFTCYVIPDERAAAFFALGLAQYTGSITAICCTSGTAALNYAPAIAEAYYQRIPILAITADRPEEWIDQGVGQSIRQDNVFHNYILKSHTLPSDESKHQYASRMINEALLFANGTVPGPVHLNVPLYEPLYETIEQRPNLPRKVEKVDLFHRVSADAIEVLAQEWQNASRKLVVIGSIERNDELQRCISSLANDPSVVVLTETHGNLSDPRFHPCIDRIIEGITPESIKDFKPDILLTFGQNLISKKLKYLLFNMKIEEHWHVDPLPELMDTYHALTKQIDDTPLGFFRLFAPAVHKITYDHKAESYSARWDHLEKATYKVHREFVDNMSYCDFQAFKLIMNALPSGTYLQMGNSASVRYIQLFTQRYDIIYHGNRGTSGIDGCTSTAAGAAWLNRDEMTCLITGDVSFFYDINGLWHKYKSPKLKIILINNRGGGIFRIIKGPSGTNQLEEYFESRHENNAKEVCKTYGLDYYSADSTESLTEQLTRFFDASQRTSLLEVFTPTDKNDEVLKQYFLTIKEAFI